MWMIGLVLSLLNKKKSDTFVYIKLITKHLMDKIYNGLVRGAFNTIDSVFNV